MPDWLHLWRTLGELEELAVDPTLEPETLRLLNQARWDLLPVFLPFEASETEEMLDLMESLDRIKALLESTPILRQRLKDEIRAAKDLAIKLAGWS
jgi:hypothetical protein